MTTEEITCNLEDALFAVSEAQQREELGQDAAQTWEEAAFSASAAARALNERCLNGDM